MASAPVSIVIPTWNGIDLLKQFLPSVLQAAKQYREETAAPTEIIVVDDGSTDQSVWWLKEQGFSIAELENRAAAEVGERPASPSLRVVVRDRNEGFGAACNTGVLASSYRLILLLNNDVEVAGDAIGKLVENFRDRSIFAAHCKVIDMRTGVECGIGKRGSFSRGFIRVHDSWAPPPGSTGPGRDYFSMFAGGGSSMIDREKFLEVGGFESLLNPFYWEDVELSYKAWKRGYRVLYEPRSTARHSISSTIRKLDQRKVRVIEQRNRLLYHWIHLHDWRMLTSHVAWVVLLTLSAPLRFQFGFVRGVIKALRLLPEVRERRKAERAAARLTDREVMALWKC
ncbi:MAG TPA: glycosyltransferase [Blastocatellia bacterium]|nr:glycosyltransferase [Blastocatellia bacterium]